MFNTYSKPEIHLMELITGVFHVISMVLILDGNSEHVAPTFRKISLFEENIRIGNALELFKCLKQIK